jgi:Uma2 family endonuclease
MGSPAAIITLDDYLRMSFEGPDAEYVDGEIVERSPHYLPQAMVVQRLAETFKVPRKELRMTVGPSMPVRVGSNTVRIPDYCVLRSRPLEDVPSNPAFLVAEVISPSDSHSALIRKLEDYRSWGAENIWVIDPELRRLSVFKAEGLIHVEKLALPELQIEVGPADLFS